MKAKIIPISKKRNLLLSSFNIAPIEWRRIKTIDNKKLSSSEIELLWTIHRLGISHNSNEIQLSYSYLRDTCGLGVSQRQLNRYLHKLASTKIIDFDVKNISNSYEKKLFIKIDFEVLENLMSVKFDRQICQSNMSEYIKDSNKQQNIETGERVFNSLSPVSSSQESNNFIQEFIKENTDEQQEKSVNVTKPRIRILALSEKIKKEEMIGLKQKTLSCQTNDTQMIISSSVLKQPDLTEQIHEHQVTELYNTNNLDRNDSNNSSILIKAILNNFNITVANKLLNCIKYDYIKDEHKMRLTIESKLTISKYEKRHLKQLIRNIYNNDVNIVCLIPATNKKAKVININDFKEETTENNSNDIVKAKPLWLSVKANLIKKHGKILVHSWFDRMEVEEFDNKITFKTSDFIANYITGNFLSTLQEISKKLEIIFCFIGENQNQASKREIIEINENGIYSVNKKLIE